ncbi:hypothetical protein CBL_20012 [Carabus blaptoides fortunei]
MEENISSLTPVVPASEHSGPTNELSQSTVESGTPSTSSVQPAIQTPTTAPSARKKPRKNQDRLEVIDDAISSISNFFQNKTEDDPDLAFGHYIGLQLKTLPARKKKLAKSNILNFMLELEED